MAPRPARRPSDTEEEISLFALLAVPIRRWRLVALGLGLAVIGALALILFWPATYTARTVLVPAADNAASRSQLLAGQLPGGLAGLVPTASPHEKLIGAVLKSRSIGDSLVSRFEIVPYSGTELEGEIRRILQKTTRVQNNADGSVVIEVRDRDPARAARIANEIPELANLILADVVQHAALRRQEFLESQVRLANDQLELSERQLVAFQQTREAPEIQEQARRTMEAAAELQNRIIQHEIQVAQLRRTATADNPEYRAAVAELNEWRNQLLRLTTGESRQNQIFLSLRESPELRASATRILREYNKNEQVYLSLTAALAEAQVSSQNQLAVVSVLDAAIVPRAPSRTSPVIIFPVALLLGLSVGLALAFVAEYLHNARNDPDSQSLLAAWSQLKQDISRLAPRRNRAGRSGRSGADMTGRSAPKAGGTGSIS